MKIQGRDKLKRKLASIPKIARVEIRKALEQSAAEIAATARNFAPARTGALKRSIGYTFGEYKPDNANVRGVAFGGGSGDRDLSVTVHVGDAKAWYARFVEFGTAPHAQPNNIRGEKHPGATARPFFFPAWRLGKRRARNRISRATLRAARQAAASGK